MPKVLIIRFSSLGDIILTTPVIRCLKEQVPNVHLHFITKKGNEVLLKSNPFIDKLFLVEHDLAPVVMQLVQERYDYVIDLHNNLRSRYVKWMLSSAFNSQVRHFTVNKLNFRKWLLTTLKINVMPDKSIVDRYLETIRSLGVKNDGEGLSYFIPKEEQLKEQDLPLAHAGGYMALGIGGQHNTKKMPVDKWKALCREIDFPLILVGGSEDQAAGMEIASIDPVRIYNSCGKFTLNESAAIIRGSRLVISHDTAVMHIAAAFRKPILSIWGNTVPSLGMFPYYGYNSMKHHPDPRHKASEVMGLSCRPCSKIGYRKCPKGHFRCMQDQSLPAMLQSIKQLLTVAGQIR